MRPADLLEVALAAVLIAPTVGMALRGSGLRGAAVAGGALVSVGLSFPIGLLLPRSTILGLFFGLATIMLTLLRWRVWIAALPSVAAAVFAPAIGIPLLALPALSARGLREHLALGAFGILCVAIPFPTPGADLAVRLGTLVLSFAVVHLAIHLDRWWRAARAFTLVTTGAGALAPALGLFGLLLLDARLRLPAGAMTLAAPASLLAGLIGFAAAVGVGIVAGRRGATRRAVLALAGLSLLGTITIGPAALLLLLVPFCLSFGVGLVSLLGSFRVATPRVAKR